jgi:thymidylate synthase
MLSVLKKVVKPSKYNADVQYNNLVRNVIGLGELKKTRNGATISCFGEMMKFDLRNNTAPLLTTKRVAWNTCLKELLWFIKGSTDNRELKKQNVHIWNQNADRTFLETRGLNYKNDGDLGPIYGHQWRHFDAAYIDCETDYKDKGVDQLQNIINSLNDPIDKFSRRLILSAWNPKQLDEMALPPCHVISQYSVNNRNELSCLLYQRSGDIGLGIPFNIASYGFLTHLLAIHCGLKSGNLIHIIGDAHIYENHIKPLKEQIYLPTYPSPTIRINKKKHIDDYIATDFEIENYKTHPPISMKMIT